MAVGPKADFSLMQAERKSFTLAYQIHLLTKCTEIIHGTVKVKSMRIVPKWLNISGN